MRFTDVKRFFNPVPGLVLRHGRAFYHRPRLSGADGWAPFFSFVIQSGAKDLLLLWSQPWPYVAQTFLSVLFTSVNSAQTGMFVPLYPSPP
jgi:hypothetical protein